MIDQLSKYYSCRILTEKDIPSILSLYESNPLYFQHCPPEPNFATVKEDMLCLPEGKAKADKFFVGFGMDLTLWLLWILSMHILMRRLFLLVCLWLIKPIRGKGLVVIL